MVQNYNSNYEECYKEIVKIKMMIIQLNNRVESNRIIIENYIN